MAAKQTNIALLALRLTGGLFAVHGYQKIFGGGIDADLFERFESGFASQVEKMRFPLPLAAAWAAALSELIGGAFVCLGIYPRVAAGFAAFTMSMAVLVALEGLPLVAGGGDASREMALLYVAIFGAIALLGGGDWRLERLWAKKKS